MRPGGLAGGEQECRGVDEESIDSAAATSLRSDRLVTGDTGQAGQQGILVGHLSSPGQDQH